MKHWILSINLWLLPEEGYYSSLNADTEDGEGEYYSWNKDVLDKTIGGNEMMATYFNVSQTGNWKPSKNILYAEQTPAEFAVINKIDPALFTERLHCGKSQSEERKK